MSSRAYDFILTVDDTTGFAVGNSIYGVSSNTLAEVISVDSATSLKVKLNNSIQEFQTGESVIANSSPIETFFEQYVFTSSPILVRGNNYGIDGTSNTFPLYRIADYKDEILVYADGALVDKEMYEFPSESLANVGIDFNLERVTTFATQSDSLNTSDRIFPGTNISNLTVAVSRGIYTNESFIGANTPEIQTQLGSATISAISPSNYVTLKNAFQQEPIVRMYSIYYPGEWYPPNANGNPSGEGAGYPWPYRFPLRYAEVIGEDFSIPDYSIIQSNVSFKAFPINYPGVTVSADGTIGEVSLTVSTLEDTFLNLLEATRTLGYNSANGVSGIVNNETVTNIDPRTNPEESDYSTAVVTSRGGINLAFDYSSTTALNGTWVPLKNDSRDLTGAVVEVKTTFASMLDVWPEFSLIDAIGGNVISLKSTSPYRVGDNVKSNQSSTTSSLVTIFPNNSIQVSATSLSGASVGDKLHISNPDADPNAFIDQKFIVTKLESLTESQASLTLANFTENLIDSLPKRRFYKNTCPWKYKGFECQYPSLGAGTIANTFPSATANGYFTINNVSTADSSQDKCAKSVQACSLRNNLQHFGGFPGVQDEL